MSLRKKLACWLLKPEINRILMYEKSEFVRRKNMEKKGVSNNSTNWPKNKNDYIIIKSYQHCSGLWMGFKQVLQILGIEHGKR